MGNDDPDASGDTSAPTSQISGLSPPHATPPISPLTFPTHSPGTGQLHLSHPHRAAFSTLRASYPLKLLAPSPLPSQPAHLGVAYTLAYGGGFVAGDVVSLRVGVDEGCGLVLLTQGSTKVFKHRPGIRPRSHDIVRPHTRIDPSSQPASGGVHSEAKTKQRLHVALSAHATLLLLPDSVSPFKGSRYAQAQRFLLPPCGTASAIILDWVNSGRGERGPGPSRMFTPGEGEEVWAMEGYASTNEVWVGERMVMRERMVLDRHHHTTGMNSPSSRPEVNGLATRLAPYHVYATVLITGPATAPLRQHLHKLADGVAQMQIHTPPELLWAYSTTHTHGGVLRLAGEEVEDVKVWLREAFRKGGVKDMVGEGLWPRVI